MDNSIHGWNSARDLPPFRRSSGAQALRKILKEYRHDSDLEQRYLRVRKFRDITRHACNYDIASRCNLRCEGCFYFEGDAQKDLTEQTDLAAWERFFAAQTAEKKVRYGYFAGAEPALAQERLAVAARYIERGSISTNGTIRIDSGLPYAILVSVWGNEQETGKFRGGGVFWKAIRNFAGDPRARFIYTVNRNNLNTALHVAHILDSEGARFSFNYYSPTTSYLHKIHSFSENDNAYFRISNSRYHLHFLPEDLPRVRGTIDEIIDRYPQTCLHTKELNYWMTHTGRYNIDDMSGIAVNCGGRNNAWHQAYGIDQQPLAAKCCTPNVECKDCRLYAPALSTILFRQQDFNKNLNDFLTWLVICEQWGHIFLTDADFKNLYNELRPVQGATIL